MVRVIDIQISNARFAGRIVYAMFRFSLTMFLFYFLPTHIMAFASLVPQTYYQLAQYVATSFSKSALPFLGILIALIVFVEILIKGTWVYGAVLITSALSWLSFDLVLLSKGLLFANVVPVGLIRAYQLPPEAISLITWILISTVVGFLLMELYYVARGVKIIRKSRRNRMMNMTARYN